MFGQSRVIVDNLSNAAAFGGQFGKAKWVVLSVISLVLLHAQSVPAAVIPTANQTLWLRADDGVTKDGSNFVSAWADQAPLAGANHATQGTAANRPLWVANQLNGHAVIRFDGTSDYLQNTAYTHGSDSTSIFIIAKRNGAPSGYHNIFMQNATYGTPATNFVQLYANAGNTLIGNFANDSLDINSGSSFSNSNFALLNLNKDASGGGSSQFFINGASIGTPGTGAQTLANNYFIGAWNGNETNGDIAEILVYNAPLSGTDRQLIEGSLAWKYGLQASLPGSHPFRFVNPNLEAAPIPEPATFWSAAAGLVALKLRRRRAR